MLLNLESLFRELLERSFYINYLNYWFKKSFRELEVALTHLKLDAMLAPSPLLIWRLQLSSITWGDIPKMPSIQGSLLSHPWFGVPLCCRVRSLSHGSRCARSLHCCALPFFLALYFFPYVHIKNKLKKIHISHVSQGQLWLNKRKIQVSP
jgi:hypothetical protein